MILDLANYAFTDIDYNKPQAIDQNKIIMQIKRPVPYGVKILKMRIEINSKSWNKTSEY